MEDELVHTSSFISLTGLSHVEDLALHRTAASVTIEALTVTKPGDR